MTVARRISSLADAPWLPAGSSAEAWVGSSCLVADPVIVVRLLITRETQAGDLEFFCALTPRGINIPTQYLWTDHREESFEAGRARLLDDVVGRHDFETPCIGYIRNVVPIPDQSYVYPVPWAHVPVLLLAHIAAPQIDGEWHTLATGRPAMSRQHWWPIVEHFLLTHGEQP